MTDQRKHRSKEIQAAIREVLYRDWDPIGVAGEWPEDEYDSYIGPVYRLLVSTPSRDAVAQELKRIEAEHLGFEGTKAEDLLTVADKLLAIDLRVER